MPHHRDTLPSNQQGRTNPGERLHSQGHLVHSERGRGEFWAVRSAPHDLRRTSARLCHQAGGEPEQIQFLLGHVSIETTERYPGCKQPLRNALSGNKIHCSGKFTQSCLAIRQTLRPRFVLSCENLTVSRFECFWHPACKQRYNKSTTFCAIRQDFSLKPARIVEFHDRPVADKSR
jgi:hypothetical protein